MGNDNDPTPGEQPQADQTPDDSGTVGVTKQRKMLWLVGIGIGVYLIGRGIWMAVTGQP